MIARIILALVLLIFPITALAEEEEPLEKVFDLVFDIGDPDWMSDDLMEFLKIESTPYNVFGFQHAARDKTGKYKWTLGVYLMPQSLKKVIVVVEPAGKVYLENGSLKFFAGLRFWLTTPEGKLLKASFKEEGKSLEPVKKEEAKRLFPQLLESLQQWEKDYLRESKKEPKEERSPAIPGKRDRRHRAWV